MRRHRLRTFAIAVAVAAAAATCAAPAGAATATVGVFSDYFSPEHVTIDAGDDVVWRWRGDGHNVTVSKGPEKFTTPFRGKDEEESRAFTTPGTYTFVCEAHGGMKGVLTVNPARAAEARPPSAPAAASLPTFGAAPATVQAATLPSLDWLQGRRYRAALVAVDADHNVSKPFRLSWNAGQARTTS